MTRQDIETAVEKVREELGSYPFKSDAQDTLIRVAEAWLALEKHYDEQAANDYRWKLELDYMRGLLNPAPKSDLERMREAINQMPGDTYAPQQLRRQHVLDIIDQLESEKQEKP